MAKQILIIGGGISGLSVLHYLKQRLGEKSGVHVRLLEKQPHAGGTIRTVENDRTLFEAGPNGFLDTRDSVRNLIKEIGLENQMMSANASSRIRYLSKNNRLYPLPTGPGTLLMFPLLTLLQKFRILGDLIIPPGKREDETVYEFGCRRFGRRFAELLLDPMVSGVFAGDVKDLNMKESFPRMHELEQKYGSLFKAMISLRKERRKSEGRVDGEPAGQLASLRRGMGQLVAELSQKYSASIDLNEDVHQLTPAESGYIVETDRCKYFADRIILSVPAYAAARLVESLSQTAAEHLRAVEYAPIAVVGLIYPRKAFRHPPKGFGYLIPSSENKKVLGVLFESNIFSGRAPEDRILLRVMIGGARNISVSQMKSDELIQAARREVEGVFTVVEPPLETPVHFWPAAIPQYTRDYVRHKTGILDFCFRHPHLSIAANYLNGIAMNDCVANAKSVADKINL